MRDDGYHLERELNAVVTQAELEEKRAEIKLLKVHANKEVTVEEADTTAMAEQSHVLHHHDGGGQLKPGAGGSCDLYILGFFMCITVEPLYFNVIEMANQTFLPQQGSSNVVFATA